MSGDDPTRLVRTLAGIAGEKKSGSTFREGRHAAEPEADHPSPGDQVPALAEEDAEGQAGVGHGRSAGARAGPGPASRPMRARTRSSISGRAASGGARSTSWTCQYSTASAHAGCRSAIS